MPQPLLQVEGLTKHFPVRGGWLNRVRQTVHAVDAVSFDVHDGEVLGVVGESGCGKSTTGRLLMHLIEPDGGTIRWNGARVGRRGLSVAALRRSMQMVFQDSHASFNPRMTILDSIAFAPRMLGTARLAADRAARGLLDRVGLSAGQFADRYPHELSGGQRQRVNICRALALAPRMLILDEAVAALDKSVQVNVLALLLELKRDLGLTYLFISHDLNVVEYLSDRIQVMYLGRVIETGPVAAVYGNPAHPYTRALLASKPSGDPRRRTAAPALTGDPPNPIDPPSGCRFRTRCGSAEQVCARTVPQLLDVAGARTHQAACLMHQPGSGHSLA